MNPSEMRMTARAAASPGRRGFTLIEILIATAISLMLMGAVITMFSTVGGSINDSRSMLETADQLRLVAMRLRQDLGGVTADLAKTWHRPEDNTGYFEFVEGPVGPVTWNDGGTDYTLTPDRVALNTDVLDGADYARDSTAGDFDDILMFTTRNTEQPFVGRVPTSVNPSGTITSDVAEVAWFIRGRTLYRRVLLVAPNVLGTTAPSCAGFYGNYDVSVNTTKGTTWQANHSYVIGDVVLPTTLNLNRHCYVCITAGTSSGTEPAWTDTGDPVTEGSGVVWMDSVVANTLGDLTNRQNRFAHIPPFQVGGNPRGFPYDVRQWLWSVTVPSRSSSLIQDSQPIAILNLPTLPTLRECSCAGWTAGSQMSAGGYPVLGGVAGTPLDLWTNNVNNRIGDQAFLPAGNATRIADDVILTNVIGFDVKVWDPGAPLIADPGNPANLLRPGDPEYHQRLGLGTWTVVGYGAYVDLGWDYNGSAYTAPNGVPQPQFNLAPHVRIPPLPPPPIHRGGWKSGLPTPYDNLARVYDTWPTTYEYTGAPELPLVTGLQDLPGRAVNGLDDDGNGVVDDFACNDDLSGLPITAGENLTAPPYPYPLRGIQVKIRVFEPSSRQVREVTIIQDFLPK